MSDEKWTPTHADLEELFVNQTDFEKLEAYQNRFNPIRVMRSENQELRHSNVLSWLFNPLETHGLGDRFLKAFLSEALKGESHKGMPTALDIVQADLRDIEVRREWLNIDLFVFSRRLNWAFIVENKFYAKQSSGQLSKYVEKVQHAFELAETRPIVRGIFLTLNYEEPEDEDFAVVGYDIICELLSNLFDSNSQSLGEEVRIFLTHYLEIIQEAAGMSDEHEEMQKLARALYREHSKVIDFIWNHGSSTDFLLARDSAFGQDIIERAEVDLGKNSFVHLWGASNRFSFLPLSWHEALGEGEYIWPGCEKWWSRYPLICWMELKQKENGEGIMHIYGEVGPLKDFKVRTSLIKAIERVAEKGLSSQIGFTMSSKTEKAKYSRFLKKNTVLIQDYQDVEELKKAITSLLVKFQPCFDAIAPFLPQFLKHAKEA